jgi:drug/metabolite transporter (DMT)-like permease
MSRRGWALFVALSIIWGIPYLFIKIAVEDLSPAAVVFARTLLAALLLLPLAAARRQLRPLLPAWPWLLLFALLEVCAPFGLLTVAERDISSSLTGLLVAAVPLIQALVSRVLGVADRMDGRRLVGLLVGFAGVAALVGIDVRGGSLLAAGAVLLAAACYATGPLVASLRLAHLPSLAVSAVAMGLSALAYAPFAAGSVGRVAGVHARAWVAVVVLGVLCSAVAFLVFFALLTEVGPSRTTVITYVNPAVAVLLGVLTLGEPVTAGLVVGFPLVLLGSYLATRRSAPAPDAAAGAVVTPDPGGEDGGQDGDCGRDRTGAESSEPTEGSATRRVPTSAARSGSPARSVPGPGPAAGSSASRPSPSSAPSAASSSGSSSSSSGASSSGTSS